MADRIIEASIKLPDTTEITIRGSKAHVAEIVSGIAGRARGSAGSSTQGTDDRVGDRASAGTFKGVAENDAEGRVHIVAADLKANSAIDAAKRLLYVGLLARRELLKETTSPRKDVMEMLQKWALYDGNSRAMLAADRAVLKQGRTSLSLSTPAISTAWGYVKDIQNPRLEGSWKGSSGRRPRRGRRAKPRAGVKSG
jgi:hypothetical protein